jgi:hypothetical protein
MTERLKNNLRKQDFGQNRTHCSLLQKFLLLEEISPIIQFPAPLEVTIVLGFRARASQSCQRRFSLPVSAEISIAAESY